MIGWETKRELQQVHPSTNVSTARSPRSGGCDHSLPQGIVRDYYTYYPFLRFWIKSFVRNFNIYINQISKNLKFSLIYIQYVEVKSLIILINNSVSYNIFEIISIYYYYIKLFYIN